jgi:hypothetical protein
MGPGIESNILLIVIALGALAGTIYLFRDPLKRAMRYFRDWAERDKREEARALAEKVQREQAEAELREKLVEDEPDTQIQKVTR